MHLLFSSDSFNVSCNLKKDIVIFLSTPRAVLSSFFHSLCHIKFYKTLSHDFNRDKFWKVKIGWNPRNYVGDLSLRQRIVCHHFLIFNEMMVQKCCCELCSKCFKYININSFLFFYITTLRMSGTETIRLLFRDVHILCKTLRLN